MKILAVVDKQQQKKPNLIIGIDGNAAAGKTTLAQCLMELYDGEVIHMDEFHQKIFLYMILGVCFLYLILLLYTLGVEIYLIIQTFFTYTFDNFLWFFISFLIPCGCLNATLTRVFVTSVTRPVPNDS